MYDAEVREPENPSFVAEEIQNLIEDNQLDAATKKMMDFSTNFGRHAGRRIEALDIRRSFNQWREEKRRFGESSIDSSRLVYKIMDLIGQIMDEWIGCRDDIELILSDTQTESNDSNSLLSTKTSEVMLPIQLSHFVDKAKQEACRSEYENRNSDTWKQKKNQFKEASEDTSSLTLDLPSPSLDYSKVVFIGKNIKKTYNIKPANFSLSLSEICLKYGEITSLIGENGNGKTTLLKIISGDLKETEGDLRYPSLSEKGVKCENYYRIKQQIAYIPQELSKWSGLLIDNLHFSAACHGIKGEQNKFEVDYIISRLGLDTYKHLTWNEISGGFKMRFALAKALVWKPKIIILDEPLANLDINTQMAFLEDLRDIADSIEDRKSIILSSQHLHEVEIITDNVIFLKDGSVQYNGNLREFGSDRTENSFEISCPLPKGDLMALLESIKYTHISTVIHNHYIINTSTTVSGSQLLKIFSDSNIEVLYFRDISKSTRRLFNLDQSNQL
ncbi:MAG: ABC transporter ATP-binding protein [Pegethrix bostrychoides GSE-TBD4-15B]|jgi:ABC-2 type transport system ATP-binding protein|uniref:ABC transporter ATP-binding protein n=1 Tax=Pegethrix bostrychoides GSE-TBD4-15B TaxID=2839662 RepID=A0A951U5I9_9CYAN|nr:ABC transporter ATP-binding protein [Pegethrix bostrychoides GSE-TBD4-15B]